MKLIIKNKQPKIKTILLKNRKPLIPLLKNLATSSEYHINKDCFLVSSNNQQSLTK